jgi:hypothetical protein
MRSESDALSDLAALKACQERSGSELRRFAADNYISMSALDEVRLLERVSECLAGQGVLIGARNIGLRLKALA